MHTRIKCLPEREKDAEGESVPEPRSLLVAIAEAFALLDLHHE